MAAACTPQTVLVTVMHSNNETGALQPVAEIAAFVRAAAPSVVVHTDAAQSIGKVAVNVADLGVDLLTLVGHKFGAPKGVAALYVKKGTRLTSFLHGGGQEGGRRAGTESVALLSALGAAAALAAREAVELTAHLAATRNRLQERLLAGLKDAGFGSDDVAVHGPRDAVRRLPNTLSIGVRGLRAGPLLAELRTSLAASAGAACHSANSATVSSVLAAMEVPRDLAIGTLRLSTGRHTTMAEVDAAAEQLIGAIVKQAGSMCTIM